MDWLEQLKKDLEDARLHPSRNKKDWEIERDIRNADLAHIGGQAASISHKKNKTGTFRFTKEQCSINGQKGGLATTKETLSKAGKAGSKEDKSKAAKISSNKVHTCQYCGETQKGNGFFRYHEGGKCLERKKFVSQVLEVYNTSNKPATQIAKEFNTTPKIIRDIIKKHK